MNGSGIGGKAILCGSGDDSAQSTLAPCGVVALFGALWLYPQRMDIVNTGDLARH